MSGRAEAGADDLVTFARRLVATPSLPGEEREAAELLAGELRRLGYRDVEVDEHGNVLGIFGEGPPRLMFNGHLDHVPPAGMDEPYGAELVDGVPFGTEGPVLRGRGSCDMKANVAAGAYAAAFLPRGGGLLGRSYLFTADVREEVDGPEGIQALLARGVRADLGLSGESTALDVAIGHRGKMRLEVVVSGRSAHASEPGAGENAVFGAVPLLAALDRAGGELGADPLFGPGTLTVTRIESEPAGETAVVPNECRIRIDRRYIPGETPETCLEELQALVARVAAEHAIRADLRLVDVYPLMRTETDHPLVGAARRAVEAATGRAPAVVAWRFGVNATFMNAAGIPSVGVGPGHERFAHTADEHVPVRELVDAARAYAYLLQDLCSD